MKIGIVDADLLGRKNHRFPNLACMKISAFHKKRGDHVELLTSYDQVENYDKVYISKVFSDTEVPDGITELSWVEYGGTGFFYDKAPSLPHEIEHQMPDYHLYDDFVEQQINSGVNRSHFKYHTDFSIGFTTRGCIRGCSFCVNKNSRACIIHSPVEKFVDPTRKYICLLDDNVFSCRDWRQVFEALQATGKPFQFKQGMDERLLTDEKCEVLFSSKWIGDYIFAFDNIRDRRLVERKLQLMRKYTNRIPKFYCFCAYNHDRPKEYSTEFWKNDISDLFERIRILFSYQALPYVMRYEDYKISPYKGIYITIARWCNQPSMAKKKTFREFAALEKSSAKYANEFEAECPEIANKYYDIRW